MRSAPLGGARAAAALLFALTALGCSSGNAGGPPTFHKDVEPIVQARCQSCHVEGGIAPFALVSYADAKANGEDMARMTSTRQMPPWGAQDTPECKPPLPWKNDERLSDAEIETISEWVAAGKLEGDPKDAPPPRAPIDLGLANASLEVVPQQPYTVSDPSNDDFRCFVIDPHLTQDQYVEGFQIVPGNTSIVHHVLVYADGNRDSLKKVGPDGSYACFGGPGIPSSAGVGLAGVWAPGARAAVYPEGAGMLLKANSLLVMQVHYHPHAANASLAPDATKFQMRFAAQKPKWLVLNALVGNFQKQFSNGDGLQPEPDDDGPPQFVIPADVSGHVEEMKFTVPPVINDMATPNFYIAAVGGHMHYVGTDVKITVHHLSASDTQDECYMQIPKWDFNWQRAYLYDAPTIEDLPEVRALDRVSVRCTYDNTMNNPKVRQALLEQGLTQPRAVSLGETTLDEMCLGVFSLVYPAPAQ